MKLAARTFAVTLVVTGLVAGAYSKKAVAGNQAAPTVCPMPVCPLNSGGCGIWK